MFCRCPLPSKDAAPNSVICPICLGYPGILPQLNREAIEKGIRLAQALGAKIASRIRFDRKNYFYPDLPKNYQISQKGAPLAEGGEVLVDYLSFDKKRSESFKVTLNHLHLEEDTGKMIHEGGPSAGSPQLGSGQAGRPATLIDFNRAGVPLLEIVTEPIIASAQEARLFVKELQRVARALRVSEASMEEGGLRVDANVSISRGQEAGSTKLGAKVEIKNLNSLVALKKALEYEIKRQTGLIKKGEKIIQETRGWDQKESKTYGQRTKEYSADYRYFPEPDLPEIVLSPLPSALHPLPVLPGTLRRKALKKGLRAAKVYMLEDLGRLEKFLQKTRRKGIDIDQVASSLLSPRPGKTYFKTLPSDIGEIIQQVLAENPQQVYNFKQGEKGKLNFLVAQVLKKIPSADPREIRKKIEEAID